MKETTVNIRPIVQRIPAMIDLYESLNDVGKARFILTFPEEDREPFLQAYEEHYNNIGVPNAE